MAVARGRVRELDERPVPRRGADRLRPRRLRRHGARRRSTPTRCSPSERSACARIADKLDWPDNLWMGVSRRVVRRRRPDRPPARTSRPRCGSCPASRCSARCPSLDLDGIDWVIAGGESGPSARPMDPAWVDGHPRPVRRRRRRRSSSSSGAAGHRRPAAASSTAAPGTRCPHSRYCVICRPRRITCWWGLSPFRRTRSRRP